MRGSMDVVDADRLQGNEVAIVDEVPETADDSAIAAVESEIWRQIALIFSETSSGSHRRKGRDAIPHFESTQDIFSKMALRQ